MSPLPAASFVRALLVTGCALALLFVPLQTTVQKTAPPRDGQVRFLSSQPPSRMEVRKQPAGPQTGLPSHPPAPSTVPITTGPSAPFLPEIYEAPPGTVALTIDDGPTPYTETLLRLLAAHHARATFFVIGRQVQQFPQAIRDAIQDGNRIGYHTWDHKDLSQLTESQQEEELMRGLQVLQPLVPYPVALFRPPYGSFNDITRLLLEKHHMKLVLWNSDPRDWTLNQPAAIAKAVLAHIRSGSMVELHDRKATVEAMPLILNAIDKMGLRYSLAGD